MYLKGDVKAIEEVEKIIRRHTLYFKGGGGSHEQKDGNKDIQGLAFDSQMFCRQYWVDIGWGMAGIKLVFDYRSGTGEIRIKDGHLQKLVKRVPDIGKALESLRPFYNAELYRVAQPYMEGGRK